MKHIKSHRRLSQKTFKPTESMLLRQAYQHDIPLIRDLSFRIWPATYSSILSEQQIEYMLNQLYSEKALMQQMEEGQDFVIVYDGVEPIGFASIGKISPLVYKLHKIYILPAEQGKGAGRFVIAELIKAVKRSGGTSLQLNVNRHNKAKSFYEKIGFTVIKEEDIDIGNGYYMNDYVMELKLR
jgi:ribosomal protein S18 acetylase RimI-like enzyme